MTPLEVIAFWHMYRPIQNILDYYLPFVIICSALLNLPAEQNGINLHLCAIFTLKRHDVYPKTPLSLRSASPAGVFEFESSWCLLSFLQMKDFFFLQAS